MVRFHGGCVKWMSVGQQWIDAERGEPMNSEKELVPMIRCVYHKSHFYRLGIKPWYPRWDNHFIIVCSFLILHWNVIQTANRITNGVSSDLSHMRWHYSGGLCLQTCHTVSWYLHKCIFTNASKESGVCPAPLFTKFTSAVRADLLTEFHPKVQ
jgi:hypothetical protein